MFNVTEDGQWEVSGGCDRVEDGTRFTTKWFLTIENHEGERWISQREFDTERELYPFFRKVLAALEGGASPKNSPKWNQTYSRYGSVAGEREHREMEEIEIARSFYGV